jgi:hypothetical protein
MIINLLGKGVLKNPVAQPKTCGLFSKILKTGIRKPDRL